MSENFLILVKDTNLQIQKVQQSQTRKSSKKSTPQNTIKLLETKEKEQP